MSLYNIQEHLGCLYYVKEEDALFRHYRLDDGGNISDMNNDRSALLYIAEGCLHVVLGHYSPRKIEKGQLLFLPKNIRFCGQSVGLSRFVASFFAGGLLFVINMIWLICGVRYVGMEPAKIPFLFENFLKLLVAKKSSLSF